MKTLKKSIFSTKVSTKNIFVEINTSFTLRDKPDRHGKHIVYLLITQKYQKERINTQIKVDKQLWKNNRVLNSHEEARDINLQLGTIEAKVNKIKVHYRLSELSLTIEKLIHEFQSDTPDFDFISFFRNQLEQQDFKPKTYACQKSILNKLEEFKPVISFHDIDNSFFLAYRKHLKTKYKNSYNTIISNVKTVKKYLRLAEDHGIKLGIESNKIKREKFKPRIIYLLPQEVALLKKYFTSEYLNPVHRLPLAYFLTSCYTGMRISDLQAYKDQLPKNIISFEQVKTDNTQFMKLNTEIRKLLESVPEFFTETLSDQKINKHLKTIAGICKVDKHITMHVGRHTFATTYVRNNGNVFRLKNLLGHDDIKTTMQYVHLIENEEMEGLDDLITY